MSGRDAQQNSTTSVPLVVVAIAHANGDEEPFILGACSAFFDSKCSTTGACAFSLWSPAGGLTVISAEANSDMM